MKIKTTLFVIIIILAAISMPLFSFAKPIVPCGEALGCNFDALGTLLLNIMNFAIAIGLIVSALVFAWAGMVYLTSGGDAGKIQEAHEMFQKVLVGFVLSLSAFAIVEIILVALKIDGHGTTIFDRVNNVLF